MFVPFIYLHTEFIQKYNNNNNIILFTAIGLLPGSSGYFTCKQNMKLVTEVDRTLLFSSCALRQTY